MLCIGICFESRIALDAIASAIREIRNGVEAGHALSILCVLQDKEKKPGLVLNVSADNLSQVQLIPSLSSRLSLVKCDSSGDALLHLYLLLMEHLRYSGLFTPGPNLLHYARLAGLELPTLTVSPNEMRGASVEVEGKLISVDTLEKIRVLSLKVLHGTATDTEILDWYLLLPQMPSGDAILDPLSRFFVNRKPTDMPGTLDVYKAVARYRAESATDTDKLLIEQFVALIRLVNSSKAEISMGVSLPKEDIKQG